MMYRTAVPLLLVGLTTSGCGDTGSDLRGSAGGAGGNAAAFRCGPEQELCSGLCVDVQSDPAHCGSCEPCRPGQACVGGTCIGEPDGSASGGGGGPTGAGACDGRPRLAAGGADFGCGGAGVVLENVGRPDNRVTYVVTGDGYTEDLLDTLFLEHVANMLYGEQGMYSDLGEPYVRYESYVNVCAIKVASNEACIDDLDTGLLCDTAFDGQGDDASRLGTVNERRVREAIGGILPEHVDVDWIGVTINAGSENWWNSGGAVMVYNGSFLPARRAASVALHEGGHAFHRLADEYDGTRTNCDEANEVNVATDGTGQKWAEWLGFDHNPGTGLHGAYEGGRYCRTGIWRPTDNSQMNILPDYFNMPSIQKMVHDIYSIVDPIDAHTSADAPLTNPEVLQVRVVDPEVLKVEWSVDGAVQTPDGGECFDPTALAPGSHSVTARVYDDTPWVRDRRDDLEQTVVWDVIVE